MCDNVTVQKVSRDISQVACEHWADMRVELSVSGAIRGAPRVRKRSYTPALVGSQDAHSTASRLWTQTAAARQSKPCPPRGITTARQRVRECRAMVDDAGEEMVKRREGIMRDGRRRKLGVYVGAFVCMLALSSLLDVRKADVRSRVRGKVQLTLQSGASLSSIGEEAAAAANPTAVSIKVDDEAGGGEDAVPPVSSGVSPVTQAKLSEQELKDDVDQLIEHVALETSKEVARRAEGPSAVNSTVDSSGVSDGASVAAPVEESAVIVLNGPANAVSPGSEAPPTGDAAHPVDGASVADSAAAEAAAAQANATIVEPEVRLTAEESFQAAQKRLGTTMLDDTAKKLVDENDLRTLQALALQATRGDCEQRSASEGGSLFKTDEEAADNLDIERTDPLWGAWCVFMGTYKSEAMRDYVLKEHILEEKVELERGKAANDSTAAADGTNADANATGAEKDSAKEPAFDTNAATLDDVLTLEEQYALRVKAKTILSHLQENEFRYLAALSMQATFGDCGPYGREIATRPKELGGVPELRKLVEPLLGQEVTRKEGALWGAWCVLQGKKRTSAVALVSQRVGLLLGQLSKSEIVSSDALQQKAETNAASGDKGTSANTSAVRALGSVDPLVGLDSQLRH